MKSNDKFQINAIGAIFNVNGEYQQSLSRSAIFVSQADLPKNLFEDATLYTSPQIVDANEVHLKNSHTGTEKQNRSSIREIFARTRALCSTKFTPYSCHPSMIPHYIYLVSTFPRNGAAGKIDRKALVAMVVKKMHNQQLERKKLSHDHTLKRNYREEENGK